MNALVEGVAAVEEVVDVVEEPEEEAVGVGHVTFVEVVPNIGHLLLKTPLGTEPEESVESLGALVVQREVAVDSGVVEADFAVGVGQPVAPAEEHLVLVEMLMYSDMDHSLHHLHHSCSLE